MKKMMQTIYKNNNVIKQQVYFMSAFYRPGEGVRALVIKDDNRVHEIDSSCLSLSTNEYNKIFLQNKGKRMKKVVVFVDVQNDFMKGGKLAFGYPIEDNLQKIVSFAHECVVDTECKIYATRDTHEKTLYHSLEHPLWQPLADHLHEKNAHGIDPVSGYLTTLEGKKLPVEHCVEGTDGWQIVDPLMEVLLGKTTFVNKPTFGSYDLADIIAEDFGADDPEEIIICGYDLSICCLANAVLLRAKFPNVKIIVKTDLCGDVDKAAFDAAVKVLQMQQIDIVEA